MEPREKKILKAISLELRHLLEGQHDAADHWLAGDLEQRLNAVGVWRERTMPADEMHLSPDDSRARSVVDAYLRLRDEARVPLADAVAEFVRETAYTWANRLLALRCMEARELIDEVVLQKEVYGGRSLEHHRLIQRQPELGAGEDDGLFAALDAAFIRQAEHLPLLFDPKAPGVALKPSVAAIKRCIALLSADDSVFKAPDALGWAYQYWNTEEKDRVFETVRTKKGAKIEGADIVPATQLYTEDYMVKFLVQNSLGATWVGMKPDTKLVEGWEYFVRDADRAPVEKKPVSEITFLDPACGSGHFLIEAFDLFFDMYKEEGESRASCHSEGSEESAFLEDYTPAEICASILTNNLFGIDIDQRAVQISEAALWMKAGEKAFGFTGAPTNLVATNIRLPRNKDHLRDFLAKHPEDKPLAPALEAVFEALQHADELGSLLQLEEPVEKELKLIKQRQDEEASVPRSQVLFEEMRRPVQTVLPVDADDWDTWKTRTVDRIREHFSEQAEAANLQEQFFGVEAEKGWKLFELLGRKYDVVAANPPWMGSGNMCARVYDYLTSYYPSGKRDLYAAFIMRCRQSCIPGGRVAMITQQSWLFLKTFAQLRAESGEGKSSSGGLISHHAVETLVQLGRYAFSELGNAVIQPVLFILAVRIPSAEHRIYTIRLKAPRLAAEQAAIIRTCCTTHVQGVVAQMPQKMFLEIPDSPVAYWLPESVLRLPVRAGRNTADLFISKGIDSCNQGRFMRCGWETQARIRFLQYAKGGTHCRWFGLNQTLIDWESDGARIKCFLVSRHPVDKLTLLVQHETLYGEESLTYSAVAQGSMGARYNGHSLFSGSGPGIFWRGSGSIETVLSILNTRLCSYTLRGLTAGGLSFFRAYVEMFPVTSANVLAWEQQFGTHLVPWILLLKEWMVSHDHLERNYEAMPLSAQSISMEAGHAQMEMHTSACALLAAEGLNEHRAFRFFEIPEVDVVDILSEIGTPSGWFPLIAGYDDFPELTHRATEVPQEIRVFVAERAHTHPSAEQLRGIKARLCSLYEAGPGTKEDKAEIDDNDVDGNDAEAIVGARIPIPTETFLEELSQKLEIHPISVYWLLKEGIEKEGWRCLPEERRITSDRLTVTILRLLGHRWPKQIEAGEPVPDWADADGAIPLTDNTSEPSLYLRVRDRLAAEFENGNVEREFEEIMGKPLSQWIVADFFGAHISQFKKRPIAWQFQIGKFNGRKSPAFACIAYYHKLSESFLPTMQSHYIRPLRQRFETELRGIENTPAASRTGDQTARRVELTALIDELNDFDSRLDRVTNAGFATAMLRQYAIDDAMLALKARWLKRLSEKVASGPLPGWQGEAVKTGLHEELGKWIGDALSHLDYFCAKVGPVAPQEKSLVEDPVCADLAKLIAPKAKSMVSESLQLACDVWWKTFDDVVLGPIKEQIKALNEQNKTLDAEHKVLTGKAEPAPDKAAEFEQLSPTERADRVRELERRMKQIKLEIKPLRDEQNEKTEKAKKLRTVIEKWTCPEADTWEPWLASQPLYDQVSALDAQRQPPATVADFIRQESLYAPDINDGVRVNIVPIQKAGLLAADVIATKDLDKAIADRAEWRSDERRWVREGKLPQPGWWGVSIG